MLTLQQVENQQAASQATTNLDNVQSMINALKNSQNPQGMFNSMLMSNPALKQANDLIQSSGGDGKATFYAEARKKGMNDQQISEFLSALNQFF